MILAPVVATPWRPCSTPPSEAPPPFASAASDDWLSGFDFGDLPPTISVDSDLAAFISLDDFVLDVSDLPLSEDPAAGDFSGSFSSFFKPDAADHEQPARKSESETPLVIPSPSPSPSPTVSSHNSEAGSSVAAGEVSPATEILENYGFTLGNANIYVSTKSSQKRQNQVGMTDLDGKAQLDPSHKKQLRLVRNRELAFESRQRKKSYVSDLEAKCKMLEQERNQLQHQICFSSAENAVLKEELTRLKKRKGSNGVAEPAVLFEDSLPLEFLLLLICLSLLLVRLSLCANPFPALVLKTVLLPRATSRVETGGLSKEQVDSNRCSLHLVGCAREYFDHQSLHFSSRVYGFLIAWLIRHLFSSSMKQRSCNFWRPISPNHLL